MPQSKTIMREFPLEPSTLENIDAAVYEFLDEKMNIHTMGNTGFKKVPVIWVSAERAFQTKHKEELRDKEGALILPLFSVQRMTPEKSLDWKGTFFGNAPPADGYDPRGGSIVVGSQIVQEKSANYANAEAKYRKNQDTYPIKDPPAVFESISIPMPVYLDIQYKVTARSNYQQHMNEMIMPFMAIGGGVKYTTIKRNGHLYEVFIDSAYEPNDDLIGNLDEDARVYETSIGFRVLGYLTTAGMNNERPKAVYREGPAVFRIMRERTMTEDEIEDWFKKDNIFGIDGKYRE